MPAHQLSDSQVLALVRALVQAGKLRWTYHAEQRMAQYGFDRGQVKQCLQSGFFSEAPYVANHAGAVEHKFTMSGRGDGIPMRVAASVRPESHVVVITVIDPHKP